MVTGAYAEMSEPLHRLASFCADVGAEYRWRTLGCRSAAEARGMLYGYILRTWGVAAARCQARLIAWRIGTVGVERLPRARRRGGGHQAHPAAQQDDVLAADLAMAVLGGMAPAVIPGAHHAA